MKLHLILYYYLRALNARKWTDRARLERWQEKRIVRHVESIRRNSPFYRELWQGIAAADWRSFPVIDKQIMMDHFDSLNTVGISREQAMEAALLAEQTRDFKPLVSGVTVGLSSGTSGNRGLFIVSAHEQAAWSGTVLAKLLPGGLLQAEKIAFFLRANSNLYESVKRGRLQFQYFDLLEPVEQHVRRLEAYRPGILIAPASMLRLLAEEQAAGRLTAQPRKIISVAEVLDPLDRRYIEEIFRLPVHQAYQCTEGFLGATCEHGTLHLNEDIVHIEKEYIDRASRRFVPIVTDFSRTSQPVVRYRLNDILTEAATPCPCGSAFTTIERIEGRCDDILYLPRAGNGDLVALFPDFVTRAVIAASPAIEHYRVVQTGAETLEISYKGRNGELQDTGDVQEQIAVQIIQLCHHVGCVPPQISFVSYNFIPGALKLRRVERRWNP
ncbi:F390 synthetase-related protein [Paenibacillus terreus]|uniref:F390 synthetase-related protein n=1 Tax=Paenibacillus terreus TaxID=1387834 RepID=A0ABV5B9Q6_9BACL